MKILLPAIGILTAVAASLSACQKASFSFTRKIKDTPDVSFSNVLLMNRKQIGSVFVEIFGSGALTVVDATVLTKGAAFAGPCDLYAAVRNQYGNFADIHETCHLDMAETRYPIQGSSGTVSSAWLSQACERITMDPALVTVAIRRIIPTGVITDPGDPQIRAVWGLFYPGAELDPTVLVKLRELAAAVKAQTTGNTATDQFAALLLTACLSEAWTVL